MTSYVSIPNADVDAESPIDVDLMTALRDNPTAITEGSSGAPKIQTAALDANVVTIAKVATGIVSGIYTLASAETELTDSAWATQAQFALYVPTGATTMTYWIYGKGNISNAYFRVNVNAGATGSTTTMTNTALNWDSETETVDVATQAGTIATFNCQSYADGVSHGHYFYAVGYYIS